MDSLGNGGEVVEKRKIKWIFCALVVLFAVTAAISGYKLCTILFEYRQGEQASEELRQYVVMEPEATVPARSNKTQFPQTATEETDPIDSQAVFPVVDFEALWEENADIVAWICLDGTNINYPVVQGTDNQYYLNHLVNGQVSSVGSLFVDCQNQPDFSDPNTVIYGHNMKNKTMLAHITDYKKTKFFEQHATGKIMTPTANYRLEVIAGYVASLDEEAWRVDFADEDEVLDWLKRTMARSTIGGNYEPQPGDRVITLSTCTYDFAGARFVLVCRICE